MKRLPALLSCLLALAVVLPAQADGRGHGGHGGYSGYGGGYGGGHRGFGHHQGGYGPSYGAHYRGSGNYWLAPVLGAALVSGAIYAANTPSYAVPQQVVVQQQYVPPSRVAYFCPTSQQFYPYVPTCQVPWQPTQN